MSMPLPNDHHKKLYRLAGTWVGEEKVHESQRGPAATGTGRFTGSVSVDGLFVIQDYEQRRDGRVTYRGHGIFGWDDVKKTSAWYWVDSMGFVPPSPSRGEWRGDTIVFEHEPVGERRGRYTFAFRGEDTYDFKIEDSQDDGKTWRTFMEATYRRET